MTASKKYVAMGSSTGGIYLFDRHTLKHSRFISNKVLITVKTSHLTLVKWLEIPLAILFM